LFDQVRYEYLPRYRTEDYDRRNRRLRFESLVDKLEPDPVAAELREFLRSALGEQGQRAALIQDLELEFGRLYWELEQFNEDYEALLLTEERREEFSDAELEELRMILGLYGVEIRDRVPKNGLTVEHVQHRQRAWNALTWHQSSVRREVAARAINRYGMILDHLMGESANGWSISGPQ